MKLFQEYSSRIYHFIAMPSLLILSIEPLLCGCGNPSSKELSKVFKQTETLAIFSVPDHCEPHFYPSSQFHWDSLLEGISEGGGGAIVDIQDGRWSSSGDWDGFISDLELLIALSYLPVGGAVGVAVGGTSNALRMPPLMSYHFRSTLSIALKDRNPGNQVARRIHNNYQEKYPEQIPRRIYWSDQERAEYTTASSREKKETVKDFSRSLYSDGNRMLLVIQGRDYGLSGWTSKKPTPCFFLTICAELLHTQDGRRFYRRSFEYKSDPHTLKEWESKKYLILKGEFDKACQDIGDMISDELFGRNAYCGS